MSNMPVTRIHVIDSHTGGEPTRIITAGGPELGSGSMAERLVIFRDKFDHIRSATVNEPRGSDVLVGALLCLPVNPKAAAGVIFFNNVGFLNMCGHGAIGLIATLAHMGRITPGAHLIETPVGDVTATLHASGEVTIENVPSYRIAADVPVQVEGHGEVRGDIAWGGNWFYLVSDHGRQLTLTNIDSLTDFAWRIRQAIERAGLTGSDGREIDHIELFGNPQSHGADSKNFVLCPGKAYDRSPCGTGTSAKVACLAADGKLAEGQIWRQESIVGTVFEASYRMDGCNLLPSIKGLAFVNGEADLILNSGDPFCHGILPTLLT